MKIGLYFGSFNPVHVGHLIIANHIASNSDLDQVWFVLSPQNPLKPSSSLLNEYDRLHLLQSCIDGEKKLQVCTVEFKLPKPSYTIDTLVYLEEKYPAYSFSVIVGSDSFQNIHRWKNYEVLVKKYPFLIYKRAGFDIANTYNANITLVDAPLLEISSTHIRELLKQGKSIRFLVPDIAKEEIERNRYYK